MAKKRSPDSNSHKNQIIKSQPAVAHDLSQHMNRIINTQDHLNEADFKFASFINTTAKQVHNLLHATGTVIELVEGENFVYLVALGSMEKFAGQRTDKNNGISGLCISTHQVIYSEDAKNDSRLDSKESQQMNAQSFVIAPFFYDNHAVGVLKIISTQLSEIDIQTIRILAGLIGSAYTHHMMQETSQKLIQEKNQAVENVRKLEKKIKHITHHDYLTGMPNRNYFNEQLTLILAKAKRRKQLIALMYLDIDHFKDVNESMGHAFGDQLLQAFSHRLKQCLRTSDIAARFGGDEFAVVVDDIKEVQDAVVISNKILQAMRQPFHLNGKTVHITTSIGISFPRNDEINADEFIRQSDQALFISKNSGRNNFYIFDNDLTAEHTPLKPV